MSGPRRRRSARFDVDQRAGRARPGWRSRNDAGLMQIKVFTGSGALRFVVNDGRLSHDNSRRLGARWNCVRLLVLRDHAGVVRFLLTGTAEVGKQGPFDS